MDDGGDVSENEPGSSAGTRVVAFAPGSVGNLSCGFDVLGLALEGPGDHVAARRAQAPGVSLASISGDGGALPLDPEANAASVAAGALLEARAQGGVGVTLELRKGLPLSGGMGGSAASAVAAVQAVDALLGLESSTVERFRAALAGERAASGSPSPDNVAPSLLGGLVLARPGARRPLVPLPVPHGLSVALVHQEVQVDTRDARGSLGSRIPMETAVRQWGNMAAVVAALHAGDWELLGDALVDEVAEPVRAGSIPGFHVLGSAARDAGAAAFGISGSGPSVFALCRSLEEARQVGEAMVKALEDGLGRRGRLYVSRAPAEGARVVEEGHEAHLDAADGGWGWSS